MAAPVKGTAGQSPVVFIVGPTASGKTDVALRLARDLGGEIIAADSRTLYRGLDTGTAKPTAEERALVAHHLVDIIDPDETYSAAAFQRDARAAIKAIRGRGKIPFVVGGSGLYIDGLLFDYDFGSAPDMTVRKELEAMDLADLHAYCVKNNIDLPENTMNKRYVIRAIEQQGINDQRRQIPFENTIVVGITTEKAMLNERISHRARSMFANGVTKEAVRAAATFGWSAMPLTAPVYSLAHDLIEDKITTEQAIDTLTRSDMRLAKKQRTWFRRNEHIVWVDASEVYSYVAHRL